MPLTCQFAPDTEFGVDIVRPLSEDNAQDRKIMDLIRVSCEEMGEQ